MPLVRSWRDFALGGLAIGALLLGIVQTSWPWIVDDAFISLRFAERLAGGDGLTWTDGERVEGYSNLLWVLANAALIGIGIDGMTAVRALGLGCTALTFAVLLRSNLLPACAPARLALLVMASLGITTTWASAGLEGPLMMLLLAIAMTNVVAAAADADADAASAHRADRRAGFALALLMWTRPDAPLWAAVIAIAVGVHGVAVARDRSGTLRRLRWLVTPPLLAIAAQLVFRITWYGDWLPNTAHAKLVASADSRAAGLAYLASNAVAMRALLLPALLAVPALLTARSRPTVALAWLGAIAWCTYIALVGGDTFPRGRLLVPALVPLCVLAAHGLAWLGAHGRAGRIAAGCAAIACIGLAHHDARRNDDAHQQLSTWEWFGKATGEWLCRAFADTRPLLAVDAAGAVPYFSRLPCIDMLGLCDRTIATTPYPQDAAFTPGHSRANGAYVLSRQPDLVIFGTPPGTPQPMWLGDRQLEADPRFLADYRIVLFDAGVVPLPDGQSPPIRIVAWTRLAGRLGPHPARDDARRLVVPGFWLGSWRQPYSFAPQRVATANIDARRLQQDVQQGAAWLLEPGAVGVLASDGELPAARVLRAGRHRVPQLPLAPGTYRLSAPDLPPGVRLSLQAPDGRELVDAEGTWRVPAAAAAGVATGATPAATGTVTDIVCDVATTVALPFAVHHLVLERIDRP